jgi:hypothetical protein
MIEHRSNPQADSGWIAPLVRRARGTCLVLSCDSARQLPGWHNPFPMFDKLKGRVRVFGMLGHDEASRLAYLGLLRASASRTGSPRGIVSADRRTPRSTERQMELRQRVFQEEPREAAGRAR